MQRFPVIIGPTAGGKTALGVAVARALDATGRGPAEVVSADSMQVYRGMDIGSAKPTPDEQGGVPHHAIDIVEPDRPFTVADWLARAEGAIADIRARGGTPVVVGGTHLYIKALLEGLFEGPPADAALRDRLHAMAPTELRAELERVDPQAAAKIHPNDLRRTVRALEVFATTGRPISAQQGQWDSGRRRPDALLVAIRWEVKEINRRINKRVRRMMDDGLLEEVRTLEERGVLGEQARQGLGYRQLLDHLAGRMTLDEAAERIKIETRRFAKSQRTWLRRLMAGGPSLWLDAPPAPTEEWAQIVVRGGLTEISTSDESQPEGR
ncbi:MAG: tRNA (adenosine(37)-N6)-dimethylallyltransferase MiaA [Phycisphaerales bacterium]